MDVKLKRPKKRLSIVGGAVAFIIGAGASLGILWIADRPTDPTVIVITTVMPSTSSTGSLDPTTATTPRTPSTSPSPATAPTPSAPGTSAGNESGVAPKGERVSTTGTTG